MKIEMSDTKGLVTFKDGDSQVLKQGQLSRTTSVLSATLTLAAGTENDTTINIPAGAICLGYKIEVLTAGATDVDITSLGEAAAGGGDVDLLSGVIALPNEAVGSIARPCASTARNTPLAAGLDLFVTHGQVNAGGAQIRVSVMIQQFS